MSKSNVEWANYAWSIISGCYRNCDYCYARKSASRFCGDVRLNVTNKNCVRISNGEYTLYQIDKPFKSGDNRQIAFPAGFTPTLHRCRFEFPSNFPCGEVILVSPMGEMFGPWIPDEWIEEIFSKCKEYPFNKYLFLTSCPERYQELDSKGMLPSDDNIWYGSTITDNNCRPFISESYNTFLNVEPLQEDITSGIFAEDAQTPAADWIVIGGEISKRKNKVIPKLEWIQRILAHCDKFGIPVFINDNLIDVVGKENMRKDYPESLHCFELSDKMKTRLYSRCGGCKEEHKKNDMHTILSFKKRGSSRKKIGYLCDACFVNMKKQYDWE